MAGKSRDEILTAVLQNFQNVVAVQQCLDVVRVTFREEEQAPAALQEKGVRLFGMWCRMDGGPPTTIVHLFDYAYEEPAEAVSAFFSDYGVVKDVRHQWYLRNSDIATGTRLVDIVLSRAPPRVALINGFPCRIWHRGQTIMCNICTAEGHKSMNCPNKNKCRLCGQEGHFARTCPNPWDINNNARAAASDPPQASGSTGPSNVQVDDEVSSGGEAGLPCLPQVPDPASTVAHETSAEEAASSGPPQVSNPDRFIDERVPDPVTSAGLFSPGSSF